uniref:Uncharacterized protein n=1 Tax=Acanthochromis polyacanthus TaxID=80966 RepID=A0A3Q1GLW2_9TELE
MRFHFLQHFSSEKSCFRWLQLSKPAVKSDSCLVWNGRNTFWICELIFCLNLFLPGTKEYDGVVSVYDDQGRADFYQSCPDCLLGIYSGIFEGKIGRMLLFYRKEGKHQDADDLKAAAVVHKKMAECLKFDVSTWFTYDGVAGKNNSLRSCYCHKFP